MSVKRTYEYYTIITANATVSNDFDDYFIDATSGNVTLTLLSASATGMKGKIITVRRVDTTTNVVTVAANGSDTISGLASIRIDQNQVVKFIRYTTTTWRSIMETKKTLSTITYATAAPAIDATYDVIQLDTTSNIVASLLPLANSVPLGTRIEVVTTNAANAGTVGRSGADTINGATGAITVALNTGRTFFTTSTTNWRSF